MATAKKLPSGNYRVLLYIGKDADGKRKYKSFTGPSKKDVEYQAAAYSLKTQREAANMTVGEAMDKYIESKDTVLSPSTVREYKRSRARDLQNVMNIPLSKLTQEMIQKEINREAKTHSPKSVRNMHGLLSATLDAYLPEFRLKTTLPQKTKPKIYVPTDGDIKVIMEAARETDLYVPILLAAFGSLRRSEICGLDKTDTEDNPIHVCNAMVQDDNGDWVIKPPKSYAGDRLVKFPEAIFKEIKGWAPNFNPNHITNGFKRLLAKNGIPHFKFHSLRHYHTSILPALGIPDQYIMERSGWSSDAPLKQVYRHTLSDKTQETNKVVFDHFEGLMQHEMQHKKKKTAK